MPSFGQLHQRHGMLPLKIVTALHQAASCLWHVDINAELQQNAHSLQNMTALGV